MVHTALYKNRKKIIKTSIMVVVILLVLLVIAPYSISAIVLSAVFSKRCETQDYLRFYVEDFEGLKSERHLFKSDGQQLVGYSYYSDSAPKGLVIISHGFGGGGQNGYMDVAYFFVKNGYAVFGYDAAGNDESSGRINGLPRGIIDLNSAIAYARSVPGLASLPIVLWGHSWGGYSAVCSLAYNQDIKAVASVSAFIRSSDIIEAKGVSAGGFPAQVLIPYVRSVERMKFGEYSAADGVSAAKSSSAGLFIAHGTADDVVPMKYGYTRYYDELSGLPRVQFSEYRGKGHAEILYSEEGWTYTNYLQEEAAKLGSQEERRAFLKAIDREKLCLRLNTQLFEDILKFYDLNIGGAR